MHRLIVFGGLSLHGPQGRVTGRASQRHRLALLALLATEHPRSLTRDELLAYLWPENDPERGRQLLRQALYQLRGTLGEDVLLAHSEEVRLDPERLGCDLWEFRDALERGDLEAAVAAFTAPFLSGFFLSGAEEFERWVEAERARLSLRYAEALELLATECEALGDLPGAAAWWRRLALHDPYGSRVALRLMRALEASGDRAGALRHAGIHATLLQAELGAEPDPEVAALTERLREQSSLREDEMAAGGERHSASEAGERSVPQPADLQSAPVRAAKEPAVVGADPRPNYAPQALTRIRFVLPRPALPLVLASVLVVGLLGTLLPEERGQRTLAMLGIGGGETLLSRGLLAERERILLADFTSPTGDTLLAGMATVAFRIDLAQSPILTLVEPQQVEEALARMQRSDTRFLDPELAREVAVREGIKAVLVGEIARSGRGYLLSAELLAAGSGEILAAHRETARDSTALLPALDRLSKQLRRRIGEPLRSLESNPPLEQVTTSSLPALRKYTQAWQIAAREGDDRRAAALLEEAIAFDTAFAMAYVRLAFAFMHLHGRSAPQAEMLTRAYRHRERLTDRERYLLLATYHTWHSWEPEKAITALTSLLAIYPEDARALHDLSVAYMMLGDYSRAEEYARRALDVDASRGATWVILGDWQFNQGSLDEAGATYRRFAARVPEFSWTGTRMIYYAAARGNFVEAERRANEERIARRQDLDWQVELTWLLGELATLRGRLRDAERYAGERSEFAERRERPAEHLLAVLNLAHHEVTLGRPSARVLARVEWELEQTPLAELDVYDRPYPDLAGLYARAGQPKRARALLAEWETSTPSELRRRAGQGTRPWGGAALPWALGEIALAEGHPLEAAEQFRRASRSSCLVCTLPHAGRAYEAAGEPDSAIAAYERYLQTPHLHRLTWDAEWRADVLERLAQLHEARGDHARAAEHYRSFIELWQDADAELQPRVREARRRLAALQGDGE
jgi:DNA-binding SARP family transcriptional activator/predicted Zn-dependent protease